MIYEKLGDELGMKCARFTDGVLLGKGASLSERVNFFYRDHLGSVRAVTDGAGRLKEQNDYYPFGACHIRSDYAGSDNLFRFNGKEQQVTGNVGYLDYGARMYDAAVGRWMVQDPLSESYYGLSAYGYCGGNPVLMIDPDGMLMDNYQMLLNGRIKLLEKTDDEFDRLYASKSDKPGDIDKENSVKLNDKSILSTLANQTDKRWRNGFVTTSNTEDALGMFLFAVHNSTAEWGVSGYRENGQTSFRLKTSYSPKQINYIYDKKVLSMIFAIHSHPSEKYYMASGYGSEEFGGDKQGLNNVYNEFKSKGRNDFPRFFVYHKPSYGLYRYTENNSGIFTRKVNTVSDFMKVLNLK